MSMPIAHSLYPSPPALRGWQRAAQRFFGKRGFLWREAGKDFGFSSRGATGALRAGARSCGWTGASHAGEGRDGVLKHTLRGFTNEEGARGRRAPLGVV